MEVPEIRNEYNQLSWHEYCNIFRLRELYLPQQNSEIMFLPWKTEWMSIREYELYSLGVKVSQDELHGKAVGTRHWWSFSRIEIYNLKDYKSEIINIGKWYVIVI